MEILWLQMVCITLNLQFYWMLYIKVFYPNFSSLCFKHSPLEVQWVYHFLHIDVFFAMNVSFSQLYQVPLWDSLLTFLLWPCHTILGFSWFLESWKLISFRLCWQILLLIGMELLTLISLINGGFYRSWQLDGGMISY